MAGKLVKTSTSLRVYMNLGEKMAIIKIQLDNGDKFKEDMMEYKKELEAEDVMSKEELYG